jgi:hypothetical protein
MFERPTQIGEERGRFDHFAEISAELFGRAAFFTAAVVLVLVWMPLIFAFASVDTWQLVLNTVTSVIAFWLIALLQNTRAAAIVPCTASSTPLSPPSPHRWKAGTIRGSRTRSRSCERP